MGTLAAMMRAEDSTTFQTSSGTVATRSRQAVLQRGEEFWNAYMLGHRLQVGMRWL
jgi:hypothetical protein